MENNKSNKRMSKAAVLRNLINNGSLDMILEAHNGLSAKIVEDTGFPAIWASGLSISSSLGVRDCNEASWSQITDMVQFMNDSVEIPILFDADSGFGNFNNLRYIVKRLSRRGIAGVSVEDKLFPKMNSFVEGEHGLTSIEEFTGKIRAAQDCKEDDDFSVIARTEALISGLSVDEALRRAEAYHEAGADAIFIHSKKKQADEIIAFANSWDRRCPLVVAPTTYADTPVEELEKLGISVYICANHLMRASVKWMQDIATQIFQERSISNVNSHISPVSSIFNLLDYDELQHAEEHYYP